MTGRRRLVAWSLAAAVAVTLVAAGAVVAIRAGDARDTPAERAAKEQQLADVALVTGADLPGSVGGGRPETDYATFADCFDPALRRTTARAQTPDYRLDPSTGLGAAVVLAATAEATISAFAALDKTDAFSCVIAAYSKIYEARAGEAGTYEVVEDPPIADQTSAFRIRRLGPFGGQGRELTVTVFRTGRGMGFLFTSSDDADPFPNGRRLDVARLMASRMPA